MGKQEEQPFSHGERRELRKLSKRYASLCARAAELRLPTEVDPFDCSDGEFGSFLATGGVYLTLLTYGGGEEWDRFRVRVAVDYTAPKESSGTGRWVDVFEPGFSRLNFGHARVGPGPVWVTARQLARTAATKIDALAAAVQAGEQAVAHIGRTQTAHEL